MTEGALPDSLEAHTSADPRAGPGLRIKGAQGAILGFPFLQSPQSIPQLFARVNSSWCCIHVIHSMWIDSKTGAPTTKLFSTCKKRFTGNATFSNLEKILNWGEMMKRTLILVLAALLSVSPFPVDAKGGGHGSGGHTKSGAGVHYVRPYVTKNGKFVQGHMQTNPNGTKLDNFSTKGNINPYTGKPGTKNP